MIDLNNSIEEIFGMLRRLLGEGLDLAWRPCSDLWPVKIDPTQAAMVLTNLCVNARDAISGTGRITIECRNVAIDEAYCQRHANTEIGEYVVLAVSDDGCGMSKKTMDRIFEPFFTTKKVGEGTGMGLATVHGVALQNGGFVNVYSEIDKGTTFRVYLPRYREGAASSLVGELSPQTAPTAKGGNETVLVAEDEPGLLALCGTMLQKLGYRVLLAETPEKAIELAAQHAADVDLILSDVIMPGMNGHDLARRVQQHCPQVPCVYMSGYTADAIARHGILNQGLTFVAKPFTVKELAQTVRYALDAHVRTEG